MTTLQTILFGDFTPPPQISSRVHRIGFAGKFGYVPPKPRAKVDRSDPNPSEVRVLKAVKAAGVPVTSGDIALKVKMTQNHCGIVLGRLFNQGLVKRTKHTKPGTRFYRYTIAEAV